MQRLIRFTALFAAALALAGCVKTASHSIVGTWDITGGPGKATMTLGADGNFKTEASMPGSSSTVTGQYKYEGDQLTLQTNQQRTATIKWSTDDEIVMTGDDGKAMTLVRKK